MAYLLHDAAGRLVKEGNKSYTYAWLDKLVSVTEAGKVSANFDYHPDGQIASVTYADGRRENYLWDGLALIHRNGTDILNEPAITGGNPVLSGDKVLFNDLLGNTLGVKDQSSYQPIRMTAFGESDNADAFFTGKPLVGELGYTFLFRNYRPEQGKWQTSDPLGYPDGWNNLAYCNNMSLYAVDPLGLSDSFDDYNLSKLSPSDYGFVKHFYTGNGVGVTLSQMGIFSAIQTEIEKQKILDRFQTQIDEVAHGMAERFDYNGPFSKSFINSYNFIDASYSIGDAVLSGTFSGNMTTYLLEDGTKMYSWSGTTTLTFSDEFTDPLGVIELVYGSSTSPDAPDWLASLANLGGQGFHVGEEWSITMSGGGIIE